MAPGRCAKVSRPILTLETTIIPPHTALSSLSPTSTQGSISTAAASKNKRGQTCGKKTSQLITSYGGIPLPVEIPEDVRAPVEDNPTRMANELGIQFRLVAPLQGVEKWEDIDNVVKAPIIQATWDKFDIKDYDTNAVVHQCIEKKCQNLYIDWKARMKRHYLDMMDTGDDLQAKENDGEKPHISVFFKDSHMSKKNGDWVDLICSELHATFERLREEMP